MTESYDTLRVERDRGVAFVTIDHPPINLLDTAMTADLARLHGDIAADGATRVVVFRSADPAFFIAHADLAMIRNLPRDADGAATALAGFHGFLERWRTAEQITIAQLDGRARGGGSEFALALDLRFAAIGQAVLGQPEVALGIIPGGGGTQRLARLLGRARALEVITGCHDVDAETAEKYGWVNRALPPAELAAFVEQLAYRIASFPTRAVREAKRAVDAAAAGFDEGLAAERAAFGACMTDPELDQRFDAALAHGVQTREVELELERVLEVLDRARS
ncbi:MAG: enoyl-CoA hydratase/isomerase family protein [Actinobacteria bacterium]|nr:enoyl-CoA hydratase/isomerase family protein [Actinomycetota bacterium]